MDVNASAVAVPVRFAGVDVLVQVTPVVVAGSELVSATRRVADAYRQVEDAVIAVASSVAVTIDRLPAGTRRPREVTVGFGLSVSAEGTVVVVKGTTAATLSVVLTYDVAS